MPVSPEQREIVERMFRAMQAGPAGETDLMALFAEDAVLVEPFSGEVCTHEGREAIRSSFKSMWSEPEPEVKLEINRVDRDGQVVRAEWTCTSPAFPAPMKGHDLFLITNGQIRRLEVIVTDMPPMEAPHD